MSLLKRSLFTAAAVLPFVASVPHSESSTRQAAELSGVVSDANGARIAEAEVMLPSLTKNTFTDDSGRFRFSDLAPGLLEIRVRRIGYKEFIDVVTIPDSGALERRITLRTVQTLAPVTVSADPVMADFEENRHLGLGKFLTRAQLEPQEHRKLSEILEQVGARSKREGPHAWVGASRGITRTTSGGGQFQSCVFLEGHLVKSSDLDKPNLNPGCGGCYAQVYLDGAMFYNGERGQVVPDINFIQPASIEGIEFYKSASQTPLKYSRLNSQCGVLVLHTRRTPGSTKEKKP